MNTIAALATIEDLRRRGHELKAVWQENASPATLVVTDGDRLGPGERSRLQLHRGAIAVELIGELYMKAGIQRRREARRLARQHLVLLRMGFTPHEITTRRDSSGTFQVFPRVAVRGYDQRANRCTSHLGRGHKSRVLALGRTSASCGVRDLGTGVRV